MEIQSGKKEHTADSQRDDPAIRVPAAEIGNAPPPDWIGNGFHEILGRTGLDRKCTFMITRKLRSFWGLSRRERRLAIATMALVAAVRLGVWTLPFRTMQRICGDLAKPGKPRQAPSADTLEIARAVRLASRYVPRATCLVQALATQILLGRHGHTGEVHIGVTLDPKLGFRAHAWVKSQGKVLVGGSEELDSYASMLVLNANGPHDQPRHT